MKPVASLVLDLRGAFRNLAQEERRSYAIGLRAVRDDRTAEARLGGPVGGSLAERVAAAPIRVARNGFEIRLSKIANPHHLTFFVQGTSRGQRARPPRYVALNAHSATQVLRQVIAARMQRHEDDEGRRHA